MVSSDSTAATKRPGSDGGLTSAYQRFDYFYERGELEESQENNRSEKDDKKLQDNPGKPVLSLPGSTAGRLHV